MRIIASRVWLFGWFLAWALVVKRPTGTTSGLLPQLSFLFGVSGVVVGLYLFFRGFRLLQRKRWIEDTPVTKISAAPLGLVKVVGKATGPYTLLSPLAGVDCYYYQTVARDGTSGQDDEHAEPLVVESIHAPLFVEDDTGMLMIDPRGAELNLPEEYDETIAGTSVSEGGRRFLRRHGLSTATNTTVTEYAIKPGDPLVVLATFRENTIGSPGSGENGACISAEAADLQRRERMEAMGVPANEMPARIEAANTDFDIQPRVALGISNDRQPFILSRETPQGMIDELARSSVLSIWGGPVLALFSLGLVLRWMGVW